MADWPHFTHGELVCPCCGQNRMQPGFMTLLERLRVYAAFPFPVSSAYRCPDYNERVSGTGRKGPHTTGQAIDVRVWGPRAYRLLELAFSHGFTGIGVSQASRTAHRSRFIHLDTLTAEQGPRPWVWSY